MAKLKARGRKEILRVSKISETPDDPEVIRRARYKAVMSDGNVLERSVITWNPTRGGFYEKHHDYGWKVVGKVRAGLSAEQVLEILLDNGWKLEETNPLYFDRGPGTVSGKSSAPLRSETRAAGEKKAAEKRKIARQTELARRSGPGFYVTNRYMGERGRPRVADHPHPFETFEEAENFAVEKLRYFLKASFDYLLPVAIVEAGSRSDAETSRGHVWWIDGKFRGPAVDPSQTSFTFERS